jgi:hypothetical protein
MRRLELTVIQLEEAKRFIQTDRIPYLRLALLLLDNAAEVLMHRSIQDELAYSDWYAQMAESVRCYPGKDDEKQRILLKYSAKIIPKKLQHAIDRDFNMKVDFLSQERQHISVPIARVLKHIHYYRNEAYHNDRIRPDSIRPAVLILFDVVCTLLATLRRDSTTWYGGDSEAWLERYGISRHALGESEIQATISNALRVDLPVNFEGIRSALTMHLGSRLDGINESIDFINENAQPDRSREEIVKAVQYWKAGSGGNPWAFDDRSSLEFPARFTLASIEEWRREVSALQGVADKLELFNWFADIEDGFEPLEEMLNELAGLIDCAIQAEIDRRRGK